MNIIWTKTAEITLNEIIDYIENDFGLLVAESYYSDVVETIKDIQNLPELFPVYQLKSDTRKAVINKKTILYYKISDDKIYLLAFYDVRKNTHKF